MPLTPYILAGFLFQNHYPRGTGTLPVLFRTPLHALLRWIGAKGKIAGRGRSKRHSQTGLARVRGDVRLAGWRVSCRQVFRQGVAGPRSRARARLNWVSPGQCCGRCKVGRRAERVIRPAREKKRRRRVLVVTTCSPRLIRAVQRARWCAITCTASQAALAAKRPEGRWFSPTPYFRSRMAFSISAWRRWSASSSRVSPSRSVMKP